MKSPRNRSFIALALLSCVAALAACSSGSGSSKEPTVISVPNDVTTIQEAVDRANEGDLILIEEGTYSEGIKVNTDNIVIRGVERNGVILDGADKFANGFTVTSNGVVIENMTLHSYQQNAVLFTGVLDSAYGNAGENDRVVNGYRVSYVTTYNNGLYGVYAFAARNGIIEHSYASGHPDSGFYVGQCRPCNAVLTNLVAENNAIGYYGTNASGNVWVVNSVFRNNRLGIAPNSQDAEYLAPQEETIVAGNLVANNDNQNAPEIPEGFFGSGIAIGGGTKNTVTKNRVVDHDGAGIILLPLNRYSPIGNSVTDNVLERNNFDLVFDSPTGTTDNNCFANNTFVTSSPLNLEITMPCGGAPQSLLEMLYTPLTAPDGPSYKTIPAPPSQPNMASARTKPAVPMTKEPMYPFLSTISIPEEK